MVVKINNVEFSAEYMRTPDEISKGMMGRDILNGCMVFKMKKGHHTFWMKNCNISLDIVFVMDNRITKIHSNCQPCDECKERFSGFGDYVIEFPSGTAKNWKIGDYVIL